MYGTFNRVYRVPRCSVPLKVLIPIIRKDIICLRVSPNVVLMFVVNMVQTSNRGNPNFSIIKFFISNKKGYWLLTLWAQKPVEQLRFLVVTVPIAEILSGKNAREWVSMDFTLDKFEAPRTIEKMKILGALLELPAKQHCQSSPFTSKLGQIGQIGSAV